MKLNQTDIITIVMVIVIPVGAYFGFFQRRVSKLKTSDHEGAAMVGRTAAEREVAKRLVHARHALSLLKKRVDGFMSRMTTEDEAHKVVGAIVDDARRAGINIELLQPGQPAEGTTFNHMSIQLTATAQFSKLYDFLLRIERNRTVMTIHEMDVESQPNSDDCTVRLELRVYFVKNKPAANNGAST